MGWLAMECWLDIWGDFLGDYSFVMFCLGDYLDTFDDFFGDLELRRP